MRLHRLRAAALDRYYRTPPVSVSAFARPPAVPLLLLLDCLDACNSVVPVGLVILLKYRSCPTGIHHPDQLYSGAHTTLPPPIIVLSRFTAC